MTVRKASVQGARRVTAGLDNFATLFQSNHEALGIPQKVAMDFAYRCDMLSDAIERGFNVKNAGYYNPAEIGEEVPGPLEMDSNNPFMKGEFTQEEFVQLAEKQMSGALAKGAVGHVADPKLAALVAKQAAKLAFSVYNAAKKSEDEAEAKAEEPEAKKEAKKSEEVEETVEVEAEDEDEEAKTAALFGLFSSK